jgi:hypothetical protein
MRRAAKIEPISGLPLTGKLAKDIIFAIVITLV